MEEKLQKDIEAIEKEKQEYLAGNLDEEEGLAPNQVGPGEGVPSVEEDINTEGAPQAYPEESSTKIFTGGKDIDVEETEFSLTEDEIEEWIIKLTELKVEKIPIELEVDEENILKINYEEEDAE